MFSAQLYFVLQSSRLFLCFKHVMYCYLSTYTEVLIRFEPHIWLSNIHFCDHYSGFSESSLFQYFLSWFAQEEFPIFRFRLYLIRLNFTAMLGFKTIFQPILCEIETIHLSMIFLLLCKHYTLQVRGRFQMDEICNQRISTETYKRSFLWNLLETTPTFLSNPPFYLTCYHPFHSLILSLALNWIRSHMYKYI